MTYGVKRFRKGMRVQVTRAAVRRLGYKPGLQGLVTNNPRRWLYVSVRRDGVVSSSHYHRDFWRIVEGHDVP